MPRSELNTLIANFDDTQLEMLAICAEKLATVKANRFTGVTLIEINSNQGGINDPAISQREVVKIGKKTKRRIRSSLQKMQ